MDLQSFILFSDIYFILFSSFVVAAAAGVHYFIKYIIMYLCFRRGGGKYGVLAVIVTLAGILWKWKWHKHSTARQYGSASFEKKCVWKMQSRCSTRNRFIVWCITYNELLLLYAIIFIFSLHIYLASCSLSVTLSWDSSLDLYCLYISFAVLQSSRHRPFLEILAPLQICFLESSAKIMQRIHHNSFADDCGLQSGTTRQDMYSMNYA